MLLLSLFAIIDIGLFMYLSIPDVIFLTSDKSFSIIKNDKDGYFKTFTQSDMDDRNIKNIDEYLSQIHTRSFTPSEMARLQLCIKTADRFFNEQFKLNKYGLNLGNTPWKLALTVGKTYEFGFPHTRIDTIYLSDDFTKSSDKYITKILIHEKIHLDQKKYPEKYAELIRNVGWKRSNNSKPRANPDINNDVYILSGFEHPLEEIAYTIDDMF